MSLKPELIGWFYRTYFFDGDTFADYMMFIETFLPHGLAKQEWERLTALQKYLNE